MVLIVGSGAGGALLAMELALANIPVTVIEKGPFVEEKESSTYFNCYDNAKSQNSDNSCDILKTTCIGGSTVVAAGNAVRCLENELKNDFGIDISSELNEVEKLLNISTLPDSHFGKGTVAIMDAAKQLGINIAKMPKFIRADDCNPCGKCSFGCPFNAKWTAADFIKIARENGAIIITNSEVESLIIENNEVKGAKIKSTTTINNTTNTTKSNNLESSENIIKSDLVVLSAGAIDSPTILQNSRMAIDNNDIGNNLFLDPFVTVGGVLKDINLNSEVSMNALITGENFILAPHYSQFLVDKIRNRFDNKENTNEFKNISEKDIISLMVKISDEMSGTVENGKVDKNNTIQDIRFISEGVATAGAILTKLGVDPKTIVSTHLRGAHPGGTLAIGKCVDKNLKTSVSGLYVCDASVLPVAPGCPPILTILGLSKRLSNHIINTINKNNK
ncbi:MAG: GMC family oxidoreductase N-terminal domain-containing protein [Methanobacteriaceae archaeon]